VGASEREFLRTTRGGLASSPIVVSAPVILVLVGLISLTVSNGASPASAGAVGAWLLSLSTTLVLTVLSWASAIGAVQAGEGPTRMGTAVLAPLVLMVVTLPSVSLVWRSRTATVERLTGQQLATPETMMFALNVFTICLLAFWLGEGLVKSAGTSTYLTLPNRAKWSGAQLVLMAIGLSVAILGSGGDRTLEFAERGTQSGQGLLVLAGWCLPVGVACGFMYSHWGSKWRLLLSLLGLALIVSGGTRSPLILIAVAFLPALLLRLARSKRLVQTLIIALGGAYVLLSLAIAISAWRGSIRYGTPQPLGDEFIRALQDPFGGLTSSGIDTVDGLLFVQALPPNSVDATLWDLRKVFTTAIPSQLYADKPEMISNILSSQYLGFGTAGMFLSGPGYLILITGGVLGAVLLFALGGAVFRWIGGRNFGGMAWLLSTYTLIRFAMGGDAFDFYQGLTLVAVSVAALVISKAGHVVNANLFRAPSKREGRSFGN